MSTSNSDEVIIACNPNAVPAEQRDQWVKTGMEVYQSVEEVQELANGFRFRLPPNSEMLLKVAEYISNERLCCAFLHFTVEIEPNRGPFWLQLSGGDGVKEYVRSVIVSNNLLPASVAETLLAKADVQE